MNTNKIEEMVKMFLTMTPEQMDHTFLNLKYKIPGIQQAYKAAKNIRLFNHFNKTNP